MLELTAASVRQVCAADEPLIFGDASQLAVLKLVNAQRAHAVWW